MFIFRNRPVSIMVMFAVALHLTWATILFIDDSAVNATAVNALYRYINPPSLLAVVIFIAALLALAAMWTRQSWTLLLLLPQQILLMMAGAGAVEAIWIAQFADGVARSRSFIAADQFYSVLAAIGHTVAIVSFALARARNDRY